MATNNDFNAIIQQQLGQLFESSLRQNQILEMNAGQIARLTEGFVELKLLLQEQSETAKQHAAVAKQQAESIERWARVVDQQSETVNRLTVMVEQFFQERSLQQLSE
jgi:predicted S18 family serine protease